MELVKTTPELAMDILSNRSRKIITGGGRKVEWINPNNRTLFATSNNSGSTYDLDSVDLFIAVPGKAKTIY